MEENTIYHYTSIETALAFILQNKEIKFNSFKKLRDPKESGLVQINIVAKSNTKTFGTEDQYDSYQYDSYLKKITEVRDNNWFAACFSRSLPQEGKLQDFSLIGHGPNHGWGLPMMWEHYGNNHQGICLGFDKQLLKESFRKHLQNFHDRPEIHDQEVIYDDYCMMFPNNRDCSNRGLSPESLDCVSDHLRDNLRYYFFLKSKNYEKEQEYRFVIYSDKKNHDEFYLSYGLALKVIFLGSELRTDTKILKIFKDLRTHKGYDLELIDWKNGIPIQSSF